jgi:hypothetical protein
MGIESAIQSIVDPNGIFEYVTEVEIVKEGRILNPFAKNLLTKKSMFLRRGLTVRYTYKCPVPYEFSSEGYDYAIGKTTIYLTDRQFVILSLKP